MFRQRSEEGGAPHRRGKLSKLLFLLLLGMTLFAYDGVFVRAAEDDDEEGIVAPVKKVRDPRESMT